MGPCVGKATPLLCGRNLLPGQDRQICRPQATRFVRQTLQRKTLALFTGIVQGTAEVVQLTRKEQAASFRIRFPPGSLVNVQTGASIALNGTCLTVVGSDGDTAAFDVIGETLTRTNLGLLREGSAVNYERCFPFEYTAEVPLVLKEKHVEHF
eukprot:jgi/Botrbrau1/6836/Bobra.152_2s0001.1